MPNFQGAELRISSGNKSLDIICDNIQSTNISYQNNRQETTYLGNYNPELNKPIINFTPVQLSFSYLKTNNNLIEENLGLLNPSGCFINLVANNNLNDYSSRDYKLLFRPPNTQNYNGQINLYSGYLSQYNLAANIGNPLTCAVTIEALDIESLANNSGQIQITGKQIISPESTLITGINFSGFGISGLQIQSFSLNLSIQRNNSFVLGQKFPQKTIVQTNGQIQINGFLNNISQLAKLSTINQNSPENNIILNLKNNCSTEIFSTITIQKPYLDSKQISNQVGNFANVSLNFLVKPTIRPMEWSGENIIISN